MTKDITTESGLETGNAGHDEVSNLDSILDSALNNVEPNSSVTGKNTETNLESAKADIPEEVAKQAEDDESAEKTDILTPPEHWPSDHKAIFETLSPEAKQAWVKQAKEAERGLSKQGEKYADQRKSWEAVETNLKSYEPLIAQTGLSKSDFIGQVVQGYANLISDPVAHIQLVMQQTGLTPEKLFGAKPTEKANDEFVDPAVKKLQAELSEVKQFKTQMEQAVAQAQRQGQIDNFQTYINNAANIKDNEGNVVYPHFDDELAGSMAEILEATPEIGHIADPEQRFQMAYDLAIARNHNKFVEMEVQRQRATYETQKSNAARTIKPQVGSHVPSVNGQRNLDEILTDALGGKGF